MSEFPFDRHNNACHWVDECAAVRDRIKALEEVRDAYRRVLQNIEDDEPIDVDCALDMQKASRQVLDEWRAKG